MISISEGLFIGAWLLLGAGLYGLMVSRNLLKIIIALQIMVKSAMMMMVVAGYMVGQPALGQSLAISIMVADTMAAVIGLALVVQVNECAGTLNVDKVINTEG